MDDIFAGQNGFLTWALMIAGLAQLGRRPVLSGVCFGLLTIKPQLGLLLPLMLVLTGQWRSIMAAIATTAALVVATGLLFGFDICTGFRMPAPTMLTTRSGGRRPKSAKARNRGGWGTRGCRSMGI